jgi:AraC-like DNA-binding protein
MTGAPFVMTETPSFSVPPGSVADAASPQLRAADLLSELMRTVRVTGSVFWKWELTAPFALAASSRDNVERLLGCGRSRRIAAFHLIAEGECTIDLPGKSTVALRRGDIVMLPSGDYHELRQGEAEVVPAMELIEAQVRREGFVTRIRHCGRPGAGAPACSSEAPGAQAVVVCGFVHSGDLFFNPVFKDLPPVVVERTASEPTGSMLAGTVRQMLREIDAQRPGSREMLGRMMELLFLEMLRRHVERLPAGSVGWLGAVADPLISCALYRLHAEPTREWTVEQLAAEVGTSRSVLADRFKAILGQPPMQYLAGWRLQLAGNLLRDGSRSIADVACEVGYDSEAAFSRAFKRHIGMRPGAWRQSMAVAGTGSAVAALQAH